MWIDNDRCTKPCSVIISRISNLDELPLSKSNPISSKDSVSVPVVKQKKARRTTLDRSLVILGLERKSSRIQSRLRTRKPLSSVTSSVMPAPVNKDMSSVQNDNTPSSKVGEWQKSSSSNLFKLRLKCLNKEKSFRAKRKWTLQSSRPDEPVKIPKEEPNVDRERKKLKEKHSIIRVLDTIPDVSRTNCSDRTSETKTPLSKLVISRKDPTKFHNSAFSKDVAANSDIEPRMGEHRTCRKMTAYSVYTKVIENSIESINCKRYKKRKETSLKSPTFHSRRRDSQHFSFSYADANDDSVEGEVRATLNYILQVVVSAELDELLSLDTPSNEIRTLLKTFCTQYGYNYDKDFSDIRNSVLNFKVTDTDQRTTRREVVSKVEEVPEEEPVQEEDNDTDSSVPLQKIFKERRKRKYLTSESSNDEEDDEMISAMMRSRSKERRNRLSREVVHTRSASKKVEEIPQKRKYKFRRRLTSEESSEGYPDPYRSTLQTRFSLPETKPDVDEEETDCGETGLTCHMFFPTLTSEDSSEEEVTSNEKPEQPLESCPDLIHISKLEPKKSAFSDVTTAASETNQFFPVLTSDESSEAIAETSVSSSRQSEQNAKPISNSHTTPHFNIRNFRIDKKKSESNIKNSITAIWNPHSGIKNYRSYIKNSDNNRSNPDNKNSRSDITKSHSDILKPHSYSYVKNSSSDSKNSRPDTKNFYSDIKNSRLDTRGSLSENNSRSDINNSRLSIKNARSEIKSFDTKISHSETNNPRSDINNSRLSIKNSSSDIKNFRSDSKSAYSFIKNSRSEIKSAHSDINNSLSDTKIVRSDIKIARSDINSLLSDTKNMRCDIKVVRSDINNSHSDTKNARSDINNLRSDSKNTCSDINNLGSDSKIARSDNKNSTENCGVSMPNLNSFLYTVENPRSASPKESLVVSNDSETFLQVPSPRTSSIKPTEDIVDLNKFPIQSTSAVDDDSDSDNLVICLEPPTTNLSERLGPRSPRTTTPSPEQKEPMTPSPSQLEISPPTEETDVVHEAVSLMERFDRTPTDETDTTPQRTLVQSCSKSTNGLCVSHLPGKLHRTPVQKVFPQPKTLSGPILIINPSVPRSQSSSEEALVRVKGYIPIQPKPTQPPPLRFSPDNMESISLKEPVNVDALLANAPEIATAESPPRLPLSSPVTNISSTSPVRVAQKQIETATVQKPSSVPVLPNNCLTIPPLTSIMTSPSVPAMTIPPFPSIVTTSSLPALSVPPLTSLATAPTLSELSFAGSTPILTPHLSVPSLALAITSAGTVPTMPSVIVSPLVQCDSLATDASQIENGASEVDISILRTLLLDPPPEGAPSPELHNLIFQANKDQEDGEPSTDSDFTLPVITNVISLNALMKSSEDKEPQNTDKPPTISESVAKVNSQKATVRGGTDSPEIVAEKIKQYSPPTSSQIPPKNNLLLGGGIGDVLRNLQMEITSLEKMAEEKRKEYHLIMYIRNYKRDTIRKLKESISALEATSAATANLSKPNRTHFDSAQVHLKETCLVRPMVQSQPEHLHAIQIAQPETNPLSTIKIAKPEHTTLQTIKIDNEHSSTQAVKTLAQLERGSTQGIKISQPEHGSSQGIKLTQPERSSSQGNKIPEHNTLQAIKLSQPERSSSQGNIIPEHSSLQAIKFAQESLLRKVPELKSTVPTVHSPRGMTVAKLIVESQARTSKETRQQPFGIHIPLDQPYQSKTESDSKKGFRPYLSQTTTHSKDSIPSEPKLSKSQTNYSKYESPQGKRLSAVQATLVPTMVTGSAPVHSSSSWLSPSIAPSPAGSELTAHLTSITGAHKPNLATWKGTVSAFLQAEAKTRTPTTISPIENILTTFANSAKNLHNQTSSLDNAALTTVPNLVKDFPLNNENSSRIPLKTESASRIPLNHESVSRISVNNDLASRISSNTESTSRIPSNTERVSRVPLNNESASSRILLNTESASRLPVSLSNTSTVQPSFLDFYPFQNLPTNYFQTHPIWPPSLASMKLGSNLSSLQAAREQLYLNPWAMADWRGLKIPQMEAEKVPEKNPLQQQQDPSRRPSAASSTAAPPRISFPEKGERISTGSRPNRPVLYGPLRKCVVCKMADAQFICSGCGRDWYCSVNCQRQNWKVHARTCVASST